MGVATLYSFCFIPSCPLKYRKEEGGREGSEGRDGRVCVNGFLSVHVPLKEMCFLEENIRV